ncbi:MAG TPA: hypothetical protein VEF06_09965 [Bryobacteraceae bacterium]|nr:hypothetical protein [Bryobacteraceae bacterium]
MDWARLISTERAGPSAHPAGDRTEFEEDLGRVMGRRVIPRPGPWSAYEKDLNRNFAAIDPCIRRKYLQLRLVCDQVAGMTDAYAVRQHRLLTNA